MTRSSHRRWFIPGLINDILDLSKAEAGKVELHEEYLDLRAVVLRCLTMVRQRADEGQVHLESVLPEDLPVLYADERRLKQILLNLLSNAVKFTPEEGRVSISAEVSAIGLRISVQDSGIGIGPEDQQRVMQPFEQVGEVHHRHREGTGLGLPLAKRLAEIHGASFELESEVGKGTTITVIFPEDRLSIATAA